MEREPCSSLWTLGVCTNNARLGPCWVTTPWLSTHAFGWSMQLGSADTEQGGSPTHKPLLLRAREQPAPSHCQDPRSHCRHCLYDQDELLPPTAGQSQCPRVWTRPESWPRGALKASVPSSWRAPLALRSLRPRGWLSVLLLNRLQRLARIIFTTRKLAT